MLEEGSFRGRTADFVFMFLFGGFLMTVSFLWAPLGGAHVSLGVWHQRGSRAEVSHQLRLHRPGCLSPDVQDKPGEP